MHLALIGFVYILDIHDFQYDFQSKIFNRNILNTKFSLQITSFADNLLILL